MKSEKWGRVPTLDKICKWIARNENDMGCNFVSSTHLSPGVGYYCCQFLVYGDESNQWNKLKRFKSEAEEIGDKELQWEAPMLDYKKNN